MGTLAININFDSLTLIHSVNNKISNEKTKAEDEVCENCPLIYASALMHDIHQFAGGD